MSFPRLLEPIRIAGLSLANRIVMPPLISLSANEAGEATERHVDHYRNSVGPGLMIVEVTAVLPEGRVSQRQLGIYADRYVKGLARLAEIIHESGAPAGIQLHHAGAKAFQGPWMATEAHRGDAGPSPAVSTLDLKSVRRAFAEGARRAVSAGFDVIELHNAHGYLLSQLLSPLTNHRQDEYGGPLRNRQRFLFETLRAVQDVVADQALITCRLGAADGRAGGLTVEEGCDTAARLEEEGLELLDVSGGVDGAPDIRPENSPFSSLLHLARAIKSRVSIPVIGVGGLRTPELAEQALQEEMADLVAVGRGILADPAWARKTIAGEHEGISLCRECSPCFHFTEPAKCPARL
jgi:2,4-dienoyl-CoA reductase-like NADH-dependent reductase (Old Yellow Enzyme family)